MAMTRGSPTSTATCSCSLRSWQGAFLGQQFSGRQRQPRRQSWGKRQLHVQAAAQELVGVLIFSALPFTVVQGLADSELGKSLQKNLEKRKPQLEAEANRKRQEQAKARSTSKWFGPDRPKYLGPLPASYPPYLRGEAPGDYGYDIAQLGSTDESFDRYFELELFHARWAMLAALGVLVPEVLDYSGLTHFVEPRWWNVGYAKLQGEDLNYLSIPGLRIAGNQGILIIAICQVVLMLGPEYARACGINALEPLGIYLPGDKNYPGGVFDPLNLSGSADAFEDLKVKEIKNGRLAMVAWLGFFAQAYVTKKGPVENLIDSLHLS